MNTYNLAARPLYTLAALTLHECTPGQSFQAALALEYPERPPFRRATGFSGFSAETADVLRSAAVDSSGHATVDFHDLRNVIPNASSSAGSSLLLEELNSAVFRVAGIRSVEYRMNGSCEVFWEWLQCSCHTVTR